MTVNTILYSLKVWLTSVFFAPALFLIVNVFMNHLGARDIARSVRSELMVYIAYVIFEAVLSFITWLLFWLIITLWQLVPFGPLVRKWFIFATGLLLTIGTFAATLIPSNFFDIRNNDVILMLANCLCIGFGTWYYKLLPKTVFGR